MRVVATCRARSIGTVGVAAGDDPAGTPAARSSLPGETKMPGETNSGPRGDPPSPVVIVMRTPYGSRANQNIEASAASTANSRPKPMKRAETSCVSVSKPTELPMSAYADRSSSALPASK